MRANGTTKSRRNVPSKTTIRCVEEGQYHMPNTFPLQESAVERAICAGKQNWTWGYEPRSVFVNGSMINGT
jgi:hypothetical protein